MSSNGLKSQFFQENKAPLWRIFRIMRIEILAIATESLQGFSIPSTSTCSEHWLVLSFRNYHTVSVVIFKLAASRTSEQNLWLLKNANPGNSGHGLALIAGFSDSHSAFPSPGICVYRGQSWRLASTRVKSRVEERHDWQLILWSSWVKVANTEGMYSLPLLKEHSSFFYFLELMNHFYALFYLDFTISWS